jgi:SAM-dependent methyltransferase
MTTSNIEDRATDTTQSLTMTRSVLVKSVFENVPRYLNSRQVDIRMRAETVKAFTKQVHWRRLLDLGCGDGSVSLPLLTASSRLTLMDLSSSMAYRARANIPEDLKANVDVRNENFMTASFVPGSFDAIVSVGVLAHVDSPEEFIAKLRSLLAPDGVLILSFTDGRHLVGLIARFFGWVKELIAPAKYRTNRISFGGVVEIFERQQLHLASVFRYANVPVPGVERFVSSLILFRFTKFVFGRADRNRNAWLGNEYICLVRPFD